MSRPRITRVALLSCALTLVMGLAGCRSCGDDPPDTPTPDATGDADEEMPDGGDAGPSDMPTDAAVEGFAILAPEDGAVVGDLEMTLDVVATPWAGQEVAATLLVDGVEAAERSVTIGTDGEFSTTLDVSEYEGIGRRIAVSIAIDDQTTDPVSLQIDRRPEALAEFRDVAAEGVIVRWHGDMPRVLGAEVEVDGSNAVERMFDFMDDWSGLLGLQNPRDQFAPARIVTDETGMEHVTFRQHFDGIPVQGGRIVASFDGNRLIDFSGNYLRRRAPIYDEQVSQETAEENARLFIPSDRPFLVGTTRLIVRDRALFHPQDESSPTLRDPIRARCGGSLRCVVKKTQKVG